MYSLKKKRNKLINYLMTPPIPATPHRYGVVAAPASSQLFGVISGALRAREDIFAAVSAEPIQQLVALILRSGWGLQGHLPSAM